MVELDARDGVSQITRQKHGVHRHPTLKEWWEARPGEGHTVGNIKAS